MASIFNDYFCSIGEQYENNIPLTNTDPCENINTTHSGSMFLDAVTPIEVEYHLRNLKNSKQNLDSVSIEILKDNSTFISNILSKRISI